MFFCLPFTTPPGNPTIAFFLAIRLTSGFISQTSFLYLTWQVYRPCRPFMFALSILCLHSFFFAFTCTQGFLKNPLVSAKYLIFFGSCIHILNSKKKKARFHINFGQRLHVFGCGESVRAPIGGWTGAQVKQLLHCLCFTCVTVQSHHQLKPCDSRIN